MDDRSDVHRVPPRMWFGAVGTGADLAVATAVAGRIATTGSGSSSPAPRSSRPGVELPSSVPGRSALGGRGRTNSTSDLETRLRRTRSKDPARRHRHPPINCGGHYRCLRGALARNPGQPGRRHLARVASPGGSPRRTGVGLRHAGGASARRSSRPRVSVPTCRTGCSTGSPPGSRPSSSRSVAEYTALNLPMLQAELDQQAARNRARSYRPGEGLEPEFEGLPLDPDPVPGAPFLFTIAGLAEEADARHPGAAAAHRRGEGRTSSGGRSRGRLREHGGPRGVHDPAAPSPADPGRDLESSWSRRSRRCSKS